MSLIITEVVHKFTIVLCERAVVCFKAPPPSPISVILEVGYHINYKVTIFKCTIVLCERAVVFFKVPFIPFPLVPLPLSCAAEL